MARARSLKGPKVIGFLLKCSISPTEAPYRTKERKSFKSKVEKYIILIVKRIFPLTERFQEQLKVLFVDYGTEQRSYNKPFSISGEHLTRHDSSHTAIVEHNVKK